jgi:hypothetical protein
MGGAAVPFPMSFYAKGLEGDIDNPDAGWKGRGVWAPRGPVSVTRPSFERVGHSVTLIGTAYNIASVGAWFPPFIETAVAVSIVYMALENIVGASLRRRWIQSLDRVTNPRCPPRRGPLAGSSHSGRTSPP